MLLTNSLYHAALRWSVAIGTDEFDEICGGYIGWYRENTQHRFLLVRRRRFVAAASCSFPFPIQVQYSKTAIDRLDHLLIALTVKLDRIDRQWPETEIRPSINAAFTVLL